MEIDYGEVLKGGFLFLLWYLAWYAYKYLRKGKGSKMPVGVIFFVLLPIIIFLTFVTYAVLFVPF